MKIFKSINHLVVIVLLIVVTSSCDDELSETYSDFDEVEFVSILKQSFPIDMEEQYRLRDYNGDIWNDEKPIIIETQEEFEQQITQFGYAPSADVNFNKYFLVGINSRTNIVIANKEYDIKTLISDDSKSLKFQITTIFFGDLITRLEYPLYELHWFKIDKHLIDCKIIVEEESVESDELMDLTIVLGHYEGILQIKNNSNATNINCIASINRAAANVSDISVNLSTANKSYKVYSESLIKYVDKVLAEGKSRHSPYGQPKYQSDFTLFTSRYYRNSSKLEVIFEDNITSATYQFVGEKVASGNPLQ